jgi:hypothetical protein
VIRFGAGMQGNVGLTGHHWLLGCGPYRATGQIRMYHIFLYLFFNRYFSDTYLPRIGAIFMLDTYLIWDTDPTTHIHAS